MKTEKWFYEIQKNADDRLYQDYDNVKTMYQDVTSERVYELKECNESYLTPKYIMVVMNKQSERFSLFQMIEC